MTRVNTLIATSIIVMLAMSWTSATATIHNIDVGDFYYSPSGTWVQAGDTVTWTLVNGTHTTSSDPSSLKAWNSGTMDTPGQSYSVVFVAVDGIGPFPYHCEFHPGTMQDTIFQDLPPEFQSIEAPCGEVSQVLTFDVTAIDPNGYTPALTAEDLPVGGSFVDYWNGSGAFQWTPGASQFGVYTATFLAWDGSLSDTMVVPMVVGGCSGGDPTFSTADPVLILSPAGNVLFNVILKDNTGLPIEGSVNAWLDFSEVSGLTPCASETTWPLVFPSGLSDADGLISISVGAGGCSPDLVKVMSTHGEIAQVPIKSLDHDGSLKVMPADFVGDDCNDYNTDGNVDDADWDFLALHMDLGCWEYLSNYFTVSLSTVPAQHLIYANNTFQVCALVRNLLRLDAVLDSAVFAGSGVFGIANPWTVNPAHYDIAIGPEDSVWLCEEFIAPETQRHGCFRFEVWPRLITRTTSPPIVFRSNGSTGGQLNVTAGQENKCETGDPDGDGDGICDKEDKCPCSNEYSFTFGTNSIPCPDIVRDHPGTLPGCSDNAHPPCHECPTSAASGPPVNGLPSGRRTAGETWRSFTIGTEYGDSLYLYQQSFLPEGWSYVVSDSGWVPTPTEYWVGVSHDNAVGCEDTGRVIFYAYNDADEYAGNAEIIVYAMGRRGDPDNSGDINVGDLTYLVSYLFQGGLPPVIIETGDTNNDKSIDVADLTYLVAYLFQGGAPPPC
ncbi:MAG: hypothetical protein ABII79_11475 [bacterium]